MTLKAKLILLAILLGGAGLASAQTPPPTLHDVLLTWNDVICSTALVTPCNPAGTMYNVYKSPTTCPAQGAPPSSSVVSFSQLANGVDVATSTGSISLSYTDPKTISIGQTACYYVTAIDPGNGLESLPSNYAQASLPIPQLTAPMGAKATVQ